MISVCNLMSGINFTKYYSCLLSFEILDNGNEFVCVGACIAIMKYFLAYLLPIMFLDINIAIT